jgi:hypothetical protein
MGKRPFVFLAILGVHVLGCGEELSAFVEWRRWRPAAGRRRLTVFFPPRDRSSAAIPIDAMKIIREGSIDKIQVEF